VELILLNLPKDDDSGESSFMQPLPSSHLPAELSTMNVYGMQLDRAVHQIAIQETMDNNYQRLFGHVACRKPDTWVGAIGCTSQVLLIDKNEAQETGEKSDQPTDQSTASLHTVLCRGSWRFVVKEVKSTIPYPIVVVDELEDGSSSTFEGDLVTLDDLEDADDDADEEADGEDDNEHDKTSLIHQSDRVQLFLKAMDSYVQQQLADLEADDNKEASPLEQSIVETAGVDVSTQRAARRQAVEEMAAIVLVLSTTLEDLYSSDTERYMALSYLAAEMANMSNAVRRKTLVITDSLQRLDYVYKKLNQEIAMQRAVRITESITTKTDELDKDLKVGQPSLPPWAKQIRKGMRLEYYWNEEWGWCEGEVTEDPLFVVDEVILTVFFEIDGETHRLPFTAEEKVRWRPPQ
jgi:hypothetical protein